MCSNTFMIFMCWGPQICTWYSLMELHKGRIEKEKLLSSSCWLFLFWCSPGQLSASAHCWLTLKFHLPGPLAFSWQVVLEKFFSQAVDMSGISLTQMQHLTLSLVEHCKFHIGLLFALVQAPSDGTLALSCTICKIAENVFDFNCSKHLHLRHLPQLMCSGWSVLLIFNLLPGEEGSNLI